MTLKEAKGLLRIIDITINRTKYAEYRINFIDGSEETAYYTENIQDAIDTAWTMFRLKREDS